MVNFGGRDDATEAQAAERLGQMFSLVRDLHAMGERGPVTVQPKSSLHGDDRRTDPFRLSHRVQALLNSSIDNMLALANLVEKAEVIHNFAPFSLIRSATESAAAAAWLLQPARRDERVQRLLRLVWSNIQDQITLQRSLTNLVEPPRMEARVRGLAEREGLRLNGKVRYSEIVRAVDRSGVIPDSRLELAWRVTSAFAHASYWSAFLLDGEQLDSDEPGVMNVRMTASQYQLVGYGRWAVDALRWGWDTLYVRSFGY